MINENLKLSGELAMVLRDKNGNVKEERTEKNLVVTTGLMKLQARVSLQMYIVLFLPTCGSAKCTCKHLGFGTWLYATGRKPYK